MGFEDKIALIAGGAKGIGEAIVRALASKGAGVAVLDIDSKRIAELENEARQKGWRFLGLVCDLTVSSQVENALDQVYQTLGKVDILVNTVGGLLSRSPIESMTEEEWDNTFALNVKSVFLVTRRVVPHMKAKRYGKILNFSSIGAIAPPAHAVHYNAAKAAIIGFTLDLARALAPFGINVNALMPGPIRTPFYDRLMDGLSEHEKEERFKRMGTEVPLGRVGTAEEVANLAVFLVSDLASYITGAIIPVSGGLPLTPLKP